MPSNFYQILNLDRSATPKDIEKAYKRQALIHHPDRNRDEAATQNFQRILEAYQTLSDPVKRASYDAAHKRPGPFRSSTNPTPPARPPAQPTNPASPKPTRSYTTPLNRQPPPAVNTNTSNTPTPHHSAYTKKPTTASRPPKQSRTFYANPRASPADTRNTSTSFFQSFFSSAPPPPEPKHSEPDPLGKSTNQEIPKSSREETNGSNYFHDSMIGKSEDLENWLAGFKLRPEDPQTSAPNFFTRTDASPRRDHRSTSVRFDSNIFSFAETPGPKKTTRHTTTANTSSNPFSYQDPELKQGPRTRTGATPKPDKTFQRASAEGTTRGRTKEDENWNRRSGHGASSWSTTADHHVHRRSASSARHHRGPSREIFYTADDDDLYGVNWPPVKPKDSRNCRPADRDQSSSVEQWIRTSGRPRA